MFWEYEGIEGRGEKPRLLLTTATEEMTGTIMTVVFLACPN